jgi:hypothetical protein
MRGRNSLIFLSLYKVENTRSFFLRQEIQNPPPPCDPVLVNVSIYLSAATYCTPENYSSYSFNGPATGFLVASSLYDSRTDMYGFVGYFSTNAAMAVADSIWVAFRGSNSLKK